ncbi:MAG: flagellar protein FlgN [Mycetocola sp.]
MSDPYTALLQRTGSALTDGPWKMDGMGANELSALIWRERELLELLVFKLEVEQLLLTTGKTRWLHIATGEIEHVVASLRDVGLARSVEVAAVAREWGVSEDATLRHLIDHAPPGPWPDIFDSHLGALTRLTGEVAVLRDTNERMLRAAARSTQETLARASADAGLYNAAGAADGPSSSARIFDKDL